MLISLQYFKSKERVCALLIVLLVLGVYVYLSHLQYTYKSTQSSERCLSELTSLKYQLNVVTEYKDHIDQLLTDTQKAHSLEKDRYKDIVDSCVAMKQQAVICQTQFEDLQVECKKVREDFDNGQKQLEQLKSIG